MQCTSKVVCPSVSNRVGRPRISHKFPSCRINISVIYMYMHVMYFVLASPVLAIPFCINLDAHVPQHMLHVYNSMLVWLTQSQCLMHVLSFALPLLACKVCPLLAIDATELGAAGDKRSEPPLLGTHIIIVSQAIVPSE